MVLIITRAVGRIKKNKNKHLFFFKINILILRGGGVIFVEKNLTINSGQRKYDAGTSGVSHTVCCCEWYKKMYNK